MISHEMVRLCATLCNCAMQCRFRLMPFDGEPGNHHCRCDTSYRKWAFGAKMFNVRENHLRHPRHLRQKDTEPHKTIRYLIAFASNIISCNLWRVRLMGIRMRCCLADGNSFGIGDLHDAYAHGGCCAVVAAIAKPTMDRSNHCGSVITSIAYIPRNFAH